MANGNLRVICINTGFEILKNLYFHIKALHWIVRQEGCWPLISSDQHPGDTVTRSPKPTGLPAGDHHTQLVIRYLAEPSAQYCCSPHIPRVMAHSWRWWFHTTWSLIVVHMIWVTVLIKSTQDQNQSSSPRDYRDRSHALTMQPGNTELKQPPKVTQPACFTQAQKQLKTCCEKGTFHLLQNTALVTSSFARHSWKKGLKVEANEAVPNQALPKHGSTLNTKNYIPGKSPCFPHSLGVYWKQDMPSDPWSHTCHSCTSEASPRAQLFSLALGSSTQLLSWSMD